MKLDDLPKVTYGHKWYIAGHFEGELRSLNGRFLTEDQAKEYIALKEALRVAKEALEEVEIAGSRFEGIDEMARTGLAKIDEVLK